MERPVSSLLHLPRKESMSHHKVLQRILQVSQGWRKRIEGKSQARVFAETFAGKSSLRNNSLRLIENESKDSKWWSSH
jgi:hypothetical protein